MVLLAGSYYQFIYASIDPSVSVPRCKIKYVVCISPFAS